MKVVTEIGISRKARKARKRIEREKREKRKEERKKGTATLQLALLLLCYYSAATLLLLYCYSTATPALLLLYCCSAIYCYSCFRLSTGLRRAALITWVRETDDTRPHMVIRGAAMNQAEKPIRSG